MVVRRCIFPTDLILLLLYLYELFAVRMLGQLDFEGVISIFIPLDILAVLRGLQGQGVVDVFPFAIFLIVYRLLVLRGQIGAVFQPEMLDVFLAKLGRLS